MAITFFVVIVFASAIKHTIEPCYASVYIFSLNFCVLFSLFKSCHDIIPYQKYYEACKYDVCYKKNDSMACASVEAYAQLCGQKSICVDWRDSADLNGLCGKRAEWTHHNTMLDLLSDNILNLLIVIG